MVKRRSMLAAVGLAPLLARAQAAAPKIAITSLVADTLTVSDFASTTGTHLPRAPRQIAMPNAALDIALLQSAEAAVKSTGPRTGVALLKVPAAGSSVDPAKVVVDGKVVADNVLVQALRQQGFTHLLTATRYRGPNQVRLSDGAVGAGQAPLEGLGFYVDPRLRIQDGASGHTAVGLVAPFCYVQLRLVDLQSLAVRGSEAIMAWHVITTARHNEGMYGWDALTPAQRVDSLEALIDQNVPGAVLKLLEAK